uniref:Uncharacterized protein n=1 Tax=Panagrolaimus superbus TaxID=310955 RepID=A0A914YH02_9BILA
MLPEHSVRAHTKHDDKEEPSRKDNETKEKTEIEKPVGGAEKESVKDVKGEKKVETAEATKKKEEKKEPKTPKKNEIKYVINKTCMAPLKPDGQPIWCG